MDKQFKLGEDIIKSYQPYRNTVSKLKKVQIGQHTFEIDEHFEIKNIVGQGAYGVVVSANDNSQTIPEKRQVAIKKIHKVFQHRIYAKRTLRELRLMRLLKHDNILNVRNILLPKSREQFDDVYVISQLMAYDLTTIIKSQQKLNEQHHKYLLYQLLRGLKFLHSAKIAHRDLKPRNILVNQKCQLKICDFGLARVLTEDKKTNVLTDYVTTRWYRAPELILSATQYTTAVDMWSVGCLFAQLLKRKPFMQGRDGSHQLQIIFELFGVPDFENITSFDSQIKTGLKKLSSKYSKHPKDLKKIFPDASDLALDLLKKFFIFDPKKRITAKEALAHPYLQQLHDIDDEPQCEPIEPLQFQFQDYDLKNQQIKDIIYEEILLYHFPEFKKEYQHKKKMKKSLISHVVKNSNSLFVDPEADSQD